MFEASTSADESSGSHSHVFGQPVETKYARCAVLKIAEANLKLFESVIKRTLFNRSSYMKDNTRMCTYKYALGDETVCKHQAIQLCDWALVILNTPLFLDI